MSGFCTLLLVAVLTSMDAASGANLGCQQVKNAFAARGLQLDDISQTAANNDQGKPT